ncbi:MAG: type VI secretion system tip protein TssI/VgrG, partial [Pseudomonadota bacterium]
EQEGIYFYFKHENGKHSLILSDGYSAHSTFPQYDSIPWYPAESDQMRERDHIQNWQLQKVLQPGRFAVRDFNFETPKANMQAQLSMAGSHDRADYEIYDYPGEYPGAGGVPVIGTGEIVARHRMEEMAAQHEIASGSGTVAGLCAGFLFNLTGCDRDDQNREYLIVESQVSFSINDYATSDGNGFEFYSSVSTIDGQTQFRAPRVTPKPMVQGPQTAVVVGPGGEEIWTDEFGRVKLQFHWDRYGQSDENSSCWVRVSQLWAGQGWGAIHIPRIGHEVIVEFLEGDPDRPIITGRVYNGENGVPYGLPANQTQSGIKSRSTKGGGGVNFNEIRMEDKKGEEELYVHAEKNHTNNTENDRVKWVGHDETVNVDNDRTETVGNDETIHIKNDRSETVDNNEQIAIGVNRSETVGNDESIQVGSNRTRTVGKNESVTVGINQSVSVGANLSLSVGSSLSAQISSNSSTQVGKNSDSSVGDSQSVTVGKDESVTIGKNRSASVGDDDSLNVGKKLTINAGDEISIVTGKAKIVMKKNGSILISGKDIDIKATGAINGKASKNIVMKGKKILQN